MISWSCRHVTSCWKYWSTVLVQYEAFLPRKTVVHYREVLVKEKIKAFRINESVLEAFRIILARNLGMHGNGKKRKKCSKKQSKKRVMSDEWWVRARSERVKSGKRSLRSKRLAGFASRRLVRRKGASWSLNWPSGANSLAHLQLKCILYVPLWLLCTCLSLFLGEY